MVSEHQKKVEKLQSQIRDLKMKGHLCLNYPLSQSNTTRPKSYKGSNRLEFTHFDKIIEIDPEKKIATVEPRVTIDQLVKATLPFGLMPAVVPEFKGITIGGAIMGGAAESSSHLFGCFNDSCQEYELLIGDGSVLTLSAQENSDLFYGVACSYGSLGALLKAKIKLIEVKPTVCLNYHFFSDPIETLPLLHSLNDSKNPPDFLDGIIFSKDRAVVIEGRFSDSKPTVNKTIFSPWYYEQAKTATTFEIMPLYDYLFRYDQGAFWMGAYLFHLPLLSRFLFQGLLKLGSSKANEIDYLPTPPPVSRTLFYPLLSSQNLWKLLHKAEKWCQERFIIQDFCIPEKNAPLFLKTILKDPATFPLWLCPIKKTTTPQLFSPHKAISNVMNFGIYGTSFQPAPTATKKLEQRAKKLDGKKVFYSHSYYSIEEFWEIYSKPHYDLLRIKTFSDGVWNPITDKVLSN